MITQKVSVPVNCIEENEIRREHFENVDSKLNEIQEEKKLDELQEITEAIWENKSSILGGLSLVLIKERYGELLEQEYFECPQCGRVLKRRGDPVKKTLDTKLGGIDLYRPYFYCKHCKEGYYPLDEALGLAAGKKQYDVQEMEAYLASQLPYEEACDSYKKCTGNHTSTQHMFETTNRVAEDIDVLDVCPWKESIEQTVKQLAAESFRRPIIMIGVDGAHAPTRPEPSARKGKRGKGQWREAKGFRIYLIDRKRIIHLISWHQIQSDEQLVTALQKIKEAGLIPEDMVRIALIGDGARWIWNKVSVLFPNAKEIIDFYHCSDYIHEVAHLQYGQGTRKAQEWVEAAFARLFHNQVDSVIWGLQRMIPVSEEAQKQINDTIHYLSTHPERFNYRAFKKAGYHIGSGAIESANKFIGHVRIKRSGAWWYPSLANNILKLRCAIYNGTFERIMHQYKNRNQQQIYGKKWAG